MLPLQVRFVEDNWENPALGAWGLGWEVWMDGARPPHANTSSSQHVLRPTCRPGMQAALSCQSTRRGRFLWVADAPGCTDTVVRRAGQEVTQYTYFQQAGGQPLPAPAVEITYGLERILMALQARSAMHHMRAIAGASVLHTCWSCWHTWRIDVSEAAAHGAAADAVPWHSGSCLGLLALHVHPYTLMERAVIRVSMQFVLGFF